MQDRIQKKKRALSEASEKTRTKLSKIVETAAYLPLAPKNKQKIRAIQAAAKRKKAQLETLPTSVTPMAEVSSASAGQASLLSSPGLVMPGDDMLSAFYSIMMAEALIETNLTFDAPFSSNPTGVSDDHPSSLTTSATAAIIIDPVISNSMAPAITLDKAPSATSSVSAPILPPASPPLPTAPLSTSLCSNSVDASDDLHSSLMTSEPATRLDPATSNPVAPAISFDITSSTASNLNAPISPPVSPPLPTLDTSLSSNPAAASDASASRIANPSKQTPAKKKSVKRQAHNKGRRKVRAKGGWNSSKLFDSDTGKPAPKGASKSEKIITFRAYVFRHVDASRALRGIYVNAKTGKPALRITKKTRQLQQHITRHSWLVNQKFHEFSKILNEGGDLPPVRSRTNKTQKNTAAPMAAKRKAALPPTLSTFVPLRKKAASASDDHLSSLTTSAPAAIIIDPVILNLMAPAIALDKTLSATSSVSASILPPANPPLPTAPLDQSLSSNPTGTSDDLHSPLPISRPAIDLIHTENQLPLPEGLTEKEMILDLSFLDSSAPSPSPDETPSAASSISTPILPPAGPPLPTAPLGTSLSSNPAGTADVSASRVADPSEQTPAKRSRKRREQKEGSRKVGAEGPGKSYKLFNIYTGKPAPEGAARSKQNITLHAYVCRHIPGTNQTRMTYVNAETGKRAIGITKETHQPGQHILLYSWLERQKKKAFSKILEEGGDLPLPPLRNRNNQQKRQAYSTANSPVSTEERWKRRKLFNIFTGKPAPKGASKSEIYITFDAYVRRHIEASSLVKTTYVNAITGAPAPGITKETYNGQHTTLYSWLVCKKHNEFLDIIKKGGALPTALPRQKHMRQKAQAAFEKITPPLQARSNIVRPRAEASSASTGRHSSLTASGHAAETIIEPGKPLPLLDGLTAADLALNHSFLASATPSPFPDTTPSARSAVSTTILPPASYPLTSPLDTIFSSNSADVFDASTHRNSSQTTSATDQASLFPAPSLETVVDDMLSPMSVFAEEVDASTLVSPTKSALTVQAMTTSEEQPSLLSEDPTEEKAELDSDSFFLEAESPNPLPKAPLYPYSAEAADAVTHPGLDPEISAEQDSFKQDTRQKRKPNVHFFFQPKENDRVGPASRKAKTMPSDGSVEHPLPEADTSDSISEVLFIPSLAAKRPAF